ncbi:MAG: hypothetical protein JO369_05350 [Paucibacter sp.]|nr:hypothetical protein [Roseateles sp.]
MPDLTTWAKGNRAPTCDRCGRLMDDPDRKPPEQSPREGMVEFTSFWVDGELVIIDLCQACIEALLKPWIWVKIGTPSAILVQAAAEHAPDLDLEPALRQMHSWALTEGDLGYAYWQAIASRLASVSRLERRISELETVLATPPVTRSP